MEVESRRGPRRWMNWVLAGAVLFLIVANIAYIIGRGGTGRAEVNEVAPDFSLPVVNASSDYGDEISLEKLHGTIVVIDFFSST